MNKKKTTLSEEPTGTYVFDKKLGKVVKVSSRIPAVSNKSQGAASSGDFSPPCGNSSCPSAGTCGMGGDDF